MNLTKELIKRILEEKLDINQFSLLCLSAQGEKINEFGNIKILGWKTLLNKKGILVNETLTPKGLTLYERICSGEKMVIKNGKTKEIKVSENGNFDYAVWLKKLHKSLQDELFKHKQKKQILGYGNVYFIPSTYDLKDFMDRWMKTYGAQFNAERIEKILVNQVASCCKKNNFSPAMKYFIVKSGTGSQLSAALEAFEETGNIEQTNSPTGTTDI